MSEDQSNLHNLDEVDPQDSPPPDTDVFMSKHRRLRNNLVDATYLGLAIGLAWAIMFLLISFVVYFAEKGTVLTLFETLYPGFIANELLGLFLGFLWSFIYAFIFGLLIGILYNSLARKNTLDKETWESYL